MWEETPFSLANGEISAYSPVEKGSKEAIVTSLQTGESLITSTFVTEFHTMNSPIVRINRVFHPPFSLKGSQA